ncbi:MAG: hypothetical protein R3F59_13530 [Myxococcota bacterium]
MRQWTPVGVAVAITVLWCVLCAVTLITPVTDVRCARLGPDVRCEAFRSGFLHQGTVPVDRWQTEGPVQVVLSEDRAAPDYAACLAWGDPANRRCLPSSGQRSDAVADAALLEALLAGERERAAFPPAYGETFAVGGGCCGLVVLLQLLVLRDALMRRLRRDGAEA